MVETGNRQRSRYSITDAGRAALADWLGTAPAPPTVEAEMLVRTLLEAWNAKVEIVDSGLSALGRAQKGGFDLILMDLQMPFMDGIEACEQIRLLDDKKKSAIPIIALTADVLSETRKKVFAVGMNDIVTKPINQAELYAALRKGLNLAE